LIPSKDTVNEIPIVMAVEAGPRYIKFFKRLLLHRIDWTAKRGRKNKAIAAENLNELEEANESNEHCRLIWEGTIADHIFPKWNIKEIRNELEGRKEFADRGVEYYWEIALNKFNAK
jgi:U4/U6 small nuclear ribonucleoprotein PRP3